MLNLPILPERSRWRINGSRIKRENGKNYWLCDCACGEKQNVYVYEFGLTSGLTLSCGCLRSEVTTERSLRHGDAKRGGKLTPEYRAYSAAIQRCTNPNNPSYPKWGGRGIKFLFENYDAFFTEVGRKPSRRHSLHRINNDGPYGPGNVRWATPEEQTQCTRRRSDAKNTYRGVSRIKKSGRWLARLYLSGETVLAKIFATEIDAAKAYNEAALTYFGPNAMLNDIPSSEANASVAP